MATAAGPNHGHDDMVHDAQFDYYGRRLATCSSDRTVKISEVEGETSRVIETLRGHDSAVWAVAWAHPTFGNILASCSYDGKVLVWREQNGAWQRIYEYAQHSDSVNAISWSPVDTGCHLACASSDGSISIITFANSNWTSSKHIAHPLGVYGISWSPSLGASLYQPSSPTSQGPAPSKRFVTAGADSTIKIWAPSPDISEPGFVPVATLVGHSDIVRDVAWAPTLLNKAYIASASQDKTVRVWTNMAGPGDLALDDHTKWKCTVLNFERECWKLSWTSAGNILAVSCGDGKITLHKESLKGEWSIFKELEN